MPLEVETRDLAGNPFRIGDWLVEPSLNRLSRGDATIQLELKVMDVLVCLAERAGEAVTRLEIVDRVWATEFISDNTLTHAVTELRNALGDDARNPSFIETIHRRGYRLIASIEPSVSDEAGKSKVARSPVPERAKAAAEDRSPYPGLAAFTEEEADFFFGREAEVGRMWRKLTSRRLLAVIGPSGVGKSSFIRAGVIPARPEGWGCIICQPGEAPFAALARALVPEFAGDIDATAQLVDIRDGDRALAMILRRRDRHEQVLLIVDQFEELFTQNPPEEQAGFAGFLRKLVDGGDVHVLLSMRDDFLYRCHGHEPLRPIFDALMPLEQPDAKALRRALIEPARGLGFAFENEGLPGEMIAKVKGERGALPMLAFAVARLWEERDRDRKLLTDRAYDEIGGVGGALGQHAEASLKAIGDDRLPIVREIFRNLVTAEGTRAVREWNELLSIFSDSQGESPEEVLRWLIDARLLTSYEVREGDEEPARSVEVVHESLLVSWPRLVRWQTQDADAALLRDQLRQAARTWDEHDRTPDFLWTGRAFREFALWRESYPGGLSKIEEEFAAAMTSHNKRRKRRRRIAVAAAFVTLLAVLGVVAASRQQAIAETNRAEAAKLLALAQVQLDTDPTEALAYATSSLELADTREARIFALRALWEGPPLMALDLHQISSGGGGFMLPAFSLDGSWLALAGLANGEVLVWNERGGEPIVLGGHSISASGPIQCAWTREGLLVTGHWSEGRVRVWSMPEGKLIRTIEFGQSSWWQVGETHLLAELRPPTRFDEPRLFELRRWELPNGEPEALGVIDWIETGATQSRFDPSGQAWIYSKGDGVYSRPLPVTARGPDKMLARHSSDEIDSGRWWRANPVYTIDSNGEAILWAAADGTSASGRRLPMPESATTALRPDSTGRWVVEDSMSPDGQPGLWDLTSLPHASPWLLRRSGPWFLWNTDFDPRGDWVVATTKRLREVSFWPLSKRLPVVVEGWTFFEFSRDGRSIVTTDFDISQNRAHRVRLWPLPGSDFSDVVDLVFPPRSYSGGNTVTIDPTGQYVLSTWYGDDVFLLSVNGDPPRRLEGFPGKDQTTGAFSPSGRMVAVASTMSDGEATLRIWDLQTAEVKVFDQPMEPEACEGCFVWSVAFIDETTLFTSGANGLLRWDLKMGLYEEILRAPPGGSLGMSMTSDRRRLLVFETGPFLNRVSVALHDLETGDVWGLDLPGEGIPELSHDGTIWVARENDGSIWVGRTDGSEPHLLPGHKGEIHSPPKISQDLSWIASSGQDKTFRLWPMPDLSKPPLHTLPREELIAKLKTLTNLRVVRDEESSTGWKLEVGPFPGWKTVPSW